MSAEDGACIPRPRKCKEREKYVIRLRIEPVADIPARTVCVEVTREVYLTHYRMDRRLKTLQEADIAHGVISLEALTDRDEPVCIRDEIEDDEANLQLKALERALPNLSQDERLTIEAYLAVAEEIIGSASPDRQVSMRAVAREAGCHGATAKRRLTAAAKKVLAEYAKLEEVQPKK